jgi:general secretion pathway protein D
MPSIKKVILLFCVLPIFAGCAGGLTAFNKGQKLEDQGKLDEAVMKYAAASAANPDVSEYRIGFLRAGEKAARVHFNKGEEYLAAKKYDEALREYQTAYTMDPSLERAGQMSGRLIKIRNSRVFFRDGEEYEKNRKMREALSSYKKAAGLDPDYVEAKEAVARLLNSRKTKLDGYEINLKSVKPITLKFRDARIKEVFNILSQLSGINFVFDEGMKDQNVTIFLENATFQQALDILTGMNKLGKKVLNESTIILYPKSPEKSKQYEDLIVQTFLLNKLDAKKAVNLIRTMLPAKKIYVNEDINALVIRDTPEAIDVARKILEANDIPDAELVLDVEIMEVSKGNADNFGLVLSKYQVSTAAFKPDGNPLSDSLATSSLSATNLLNAFNWRGFNGFLTVPNAAYNFEKTLANGQTLANPKIRVKNREKSKFNVGTRVPITTTSTTGTTGGFAVNVQYVDVGVKVNAEPTVQLNDDINIKLSLEVSSVISKQTVGGSDSSTTVVTIGTRNLDTVLSLKDGETSIIGGLLQDNRSDSKKKISILGDIPILGPLLTGTNKTNDKTELILAITPHIVRAITVPDADVAAFWSGKEDDPSTADPYASFIQEPDIPAPLSSPPAAPGPQEMPGPAVAPTAPAAPNVPFTPPAAAPTAIPAPPTMPVTPQPVPLPDAMSKMLLNLTAPSSVKMNEQFNVEVVGSNMANLYNAPFVLSYDPAFLDYMGASEGSLLKSDGKPTVFQATGVKNSGQVAVNLARTGNDSGMNGTGTLVTVIFKAKKPGAAGLGFVKANFTDPGGKPLSVIPFNTVVEVK